jgi:hypothetical protein
MKYIKLFETYKTIDEIKDWLDKYGIKNYTINDDLTVDVDGDVDLSYKELTKIKVQFRNVGGYFYCIDNQLTSLEGAPSSVGTGFDCSNNQLISLEGCPSSVGGNFYCYNNQLTSLEGCPSSVGGHFYCSNNQLTSLEGCPSSVGGYFYCYNNKLTSLEGCPSSVGGDFSCSYNQLTSLKGAPSSVGDDFHCSCNQLTSLEGAPVDCMCEGRLYNRTNNKFSWDQDELDVYWEEQIENDSLVFKKLKLNNKKIADKSNQISQELYDKYKYINRVNIYGYECLIRVRFHGVRDGDGGDGDGDVSICQ